MHYILYYGALPCCIKNLSKSERCVKINLYIVLTHIVRYWQYFFTEQEKIIMGFEIENGVLKKYTEEPGVTEVVVPDGVTSIGYRAFYERSRLTVVTIPDSVTSIGDSAFLGCESLTSVVIPDSVTSISMTALFS